MAIIKKQKTVYITQEVHDKLKKKAEAKNLKLATFLELHLNELANSK